MPSSNAVRPSNSRDHVARTAPHPTDCEISIVAQSVLHPAVVLGQKNRTLAEELEDFVDRIAELKAAVFDAETRSSVVVKRPLK